jgi:hypothetical protein
MAERGICSVCGRSINLLNDGRIGRHGDRTTKGAWPPRNCDGWGKAPKEDQK